MTIENRPIFILTIEIFFQFTLVDFNARVHNKNMYTYMIKTKHPFQGVLDLFWVWN